MKQTNAMHSLIIEIVAKGTEIEPDEFMNQDTVDECVFSHVDYVSDVPDDERGEAIERMQRHLPEYIKADIEAGTIEIVSDPVGLAKTELETARGLLAKATPEDMCNWVCLDVFNAVHALGEGCWNTIMVKYEGGYTPIKKWVMERRDDFLAGNAQYSVCGILDYHF